MVRKIMQREFDSRQGNLLVGGYCKAQKEDRFRELEEDYLLNLKHLQQVAENAFNRFISRAH